ncbi:hypothetical protein [Microbacterium hominis]|uniref:Glycosyltransferase n=1 Tax=Microbacterium hominis TaxID=162426 RepID=A0A7D4Q2G9_9MICO|nr:hypothetical protein [Microbacterium hominis]QKJ20352.1 hypothetical protein HQM25_13940 [Microbacterium hominis]
MVVHETHRPPAPILRYIDQVVGDDSDIEFRFSQGVLTRFDVDVVHVVEPNLDQLLGTRGASGLQRVLATLALRRNLRRHRIALVRTLPGVGERVSRGRGERLARRILDGATSAFITFDETTPTPDAARTTVIPHAHFRERFVGYPRAEQIPGRILCVVSGALPNSVRSMLTIANLSDAAGVTLRIAGDAPDELGIAVHSAIARCAGLVSARLERLSDGAQVQELDAAELVAVPQVTSLEDLQLVFLALSLDRPVLTPRTDQMAELAAAVGPGWVNLCDGPITAQDLDDALECIRGGTPPTRPDLDGRDLTRTQQLHEAVLQGALRAPGD